MPDPHETFHDLCLAYGDFNRPVFLEAFLHWFVNSADSKELATLRRGIQTRAKLLRSQGKRGRPRAGESWRWLCATLRLVWQREIAR
ncbi:MAG TPA: hypothetical protein VJW51_04510 [Candidatus Acidoferrales bacterium]|nr:hypothetical protein [Candidatus Acidoferrales bacterium]